VELNPDSPEGRYNLANALAVLGERKAAVGQLRETLRVRPDWPQALASLAGLEMTAPGAAGDPEEPIRLASRAADLSGRRDPYILDVLAAAYAAAGRFTDATRTAQAAEAALASGSAPDLAAQIRAHVGLYRARSEGH
jgi:tetratricopeptide (TPR) repeat protein